MHVAITDTENNNVVAVVPINMIGMDYKPDDAEYFKEAWACAVEDKSVDPDRKSKYAFSFVSP